MRQIDWNKGFSALNLILEHPSAEKGYKDLSFFYLSNKMQQNAEAINFLIKEKFNDNDSNISKKQ